MTQQSQLHSYSLLSLAWLAITLSSAQGNDDKKLHQHFTQLVKPFINTYCINCHGKINPRAKFDLSPYTSLQSVTSDMGHWKLLLERLTRKEMPPPKAKKHPDNKLRQQVIDWIESLRRFEAAKKAGDPGPVLARRLSNAEYNYTIHDLTGVDIQPTKDFPIDPANQAGFDNSGESLTLSSALLKKYLEAARQVSNHLLFLPDGIDFAPYPVVIYSNRDKYFVHRIVNFYQRHSTDYADYFVAAWQYRHRTSLGLPKATIKDIAKAQGVSPKYLTTIWNLLTESKNEVGPIQELQHRWRQLPSPNQPAKLVRGACEQLRDWVRKKRREYQLPIGNYYVKQLNKSSQPLILAKDRAIANNRRRGKLPKADGTKETERFRQSIATFCSIFPDVFYVPERGRMFQKAGLDRALDPKKRSTGRLLSAGFHLMFGYFRDDQPLYDLLLNQEEQQQLDQMWQELLFATEAPKRQFSDYIYFERAEYPAFLKNKEFDFVREDAEITSQAKIQRFAKLYLAKAKASGIDERVLMLIKHFFQEIATDIKKLEQTQATAEPKHVQAILTFAERAWQRPLTLKDRNDLIDFYRSSRKELGLSHQDAIRDTLVSILMSPRFFFRSTETKPGKKPQPLSDDELASRLSYFLWSSLPDRELLEKAKQGDLHNPKVLLQQAKRMMNDGRIHRLAIEFGGHWLDFRRFQTHNGVNRERFPKFSDPLRQAMYEEPIRFMTNLIQRDGSVLDLVNGKHTFVNKVLAEHYGIPHNHSNPKAWIKINNAHLYGRGGLLPMSVFLTKNSPGLRTSPVKRGYWVVRRLLGEHIPPPPPEVPELPADEAKLGELSVRDVLAKHREVKSCAQCHNRFDTIGLTFEDYGPIGTRRKRDLGGRTIDNSATFPDGSKGKGIEGLKKYLQSSRQAEFIDNLCRKLLAYGLGRSLLLSDESTIETMKKQLATNEYRFSVLVETIITSPQFLRARGRD